MENKAKACLVTAALVAGGIGAGVVVTSAAAANPSSPGAQPAGQQYVFACVKNGKIDYLEYRAPLPHQCWFSGETLWHWAVVPAPTASASASPSATPSASPSPSPCSCPSSSPSPSPFSCPSSSPPPSPSPSPSASSSR